MQNINRGVLVGPIRASDYKLGDATQIQIARVVKDWSIYLPTFESQRNSVTDFLDCVTFSAGHCIEMQLNYLMSTNQLSDEALNFFHNNDYIVDGVFHISKRFSAKMNGTDISKGQYLNIAGDHFRSDGFIPDSMWSETPEMTWDQYYAPVPQNLIDLGKKALWFISIQYQAVPSEDVTTSLPATPIQCATEICAGWDSGQMVQKCSGQPIQHATVIYAQDSSMNWKDLDQYPPFIQELAAGYELPLNQQYVVTAKPLILRVGMHGADVVTLQEDLNDLGFNLNDDGLYGSATQTAVKNIQNKTGLVADGLAGPLTLGKIKDMLQTPSETSIKDIITNVCNEYGISPNVLISVATCESGLNPLAKLFNPGSNSTDRGLFQWNSVYHSEISDADAYDPTKATQWACNYLKADPKNLHGFWSASEHCWSPNLSPSEKQEYGIQ